MKPSIPKGTRDFLPDQVFKRNYIFNSIRSVFEIYGYVPIETPSFEVLSTLTGKYGEEGDRLLFKILNNGDFLAEADIEQLKDKNSKAIINQISKRGLRYDLTVPFARFVVMHENDINFPFKRYQIQPVWRADRPQKGRYQEFYQCDADAIGSESLMYEAELMCIYDDVFAKLGIGVQIRINNRKILEEIAGFTDCKDNFTGLTVAIDKFDKIGWKGVEEELVKIGLDDNKRHLINQFLNIKNFEDLKSWFEKNSIVSSGIEELNQVFDFLKSHQFVNELVYDPTLARGLNYYTGCIFEVTAKDATIGSLGGGGRYAELTQVFGRSGMSGVGISFGAERIFDVMEELNLFSADISHSIDLLFIALDENSHKGAFNIVSNLRSKGLKCDIYPSHGNMKKQMKYANNISVPQVVIIGQNELVKEKVILKNMLTGEQKEIGIEDVYAELTQGK